MKTDVEIKELALGVYRGEIFTDRHIRSSDASLLTSIFMPLGFMDDKTAKKVDEDKPVMFYAPLAGAMPRSINGYPFLPSVAYLNEEEFVRFAAVHKALIEAIEKVCVL